METELDTSLVDFMKKDSTIFYSHAHLQLPSSKQELIGIVTAAGAQGRKVRVVGAGHSFSEVACPDDILVSMKNFKGLVSVDKASHQVTVKAGTTLRELIELLHQHKLAMTNLGAIPYQTVAGAISTGTHGTGVRFGNLATLVTKLELVTGNGEIITVSATQSGDIFRAAQVSMGLLGVITEVTFQCEPEFNLEETITTPPFDECIDNLGQLADSAEHVKIWLELCSRSCAYYQTNRTKDESRNRPNRFVATLKNILLEFVINIASRVPGATYAAMKFIFKALQLFSPQNRVDISDEILVVPNYFPVHSQAEIAVGIDDCTAAMREVDRIVNELVIPVNYIIEVRFVRGDDIWLSPNYKRDSCHITEMIYSPSVETSILYFNSVHNATKKFNARLHWGKHFQLTPEDVQAMYPKFADFARIRAKLDPRGVFLNELLATTFGFK